MLIQRYRHLNLIFKPFLTLQVNESILKTFDDLDSRKQERSQYSYRKFLSFKVGRAQLVRQNEENITRYCKWLILPLKPRRF